MTDSSDRTDYRNQLREAGGANVKRTICEVHREIYDRIEDLGLADDPIIVPLLEDAYAIGKKLVLKLRQHKLNKDGDWYAAEKPAVLAETLAKRRARKAARIEAEARARAERKEARDAAYLQRKLAGKKPVA